ncbi:MAG TPA: L-histidine N(alpha)-methyltransferase [Sphingomicrobium sp.]|nr:L-histidine N(alpha)-methyltransferase [Sphingomicrobium sp.]
MLKTPDRADPAFRADVIDGLAEPISAIPARWLYDRRGSELFDDITKLPSYYPTRTETALLEAKADAIARRIEAGSALVEFGSGSSAKTPIMLRALAPKAYVPIDISGDYLLESAAAVDRDFPGVAVYPVEADFTGPLRLPTAIEPMSRLGFFPGSTIGNFVPRTATDLLRHFRDLLGTGAKLLIGMDLVKPVERLIAAYDDPEGVTARFNLNLLHRINRELGGDIPVDAFAHEARWNEMLGRIEMHLVARRDVKFAIGGHSFAFAGGHSIHTENSHKYSPRSARLLLLAGGWTPVGEWVDEEEDFALILAEAQRKRFAP